MHNEILFSITMKKILSSTATRMNLEVIMLDEISPAQKRQILHEITYMWNLAKMDLQKQNRMVGRLLQIGKWGVLIKGYSSSSAK
jgi:hypothetical protein